MFARIVLIVDWLPIQICFWDNDENSHIGPLLPIVESVIVYTDRERDLLWKTSFI